MLYASETSKPLYFLLNLFFFLNLQSCSKEFVSGQLLRLTTLEPSCLSLHIHIHTLSRWTFLSWKWMLLLHPVTMASVQTFACTGWDIAVASFLYSSMSSLLPPTLSPSQQIYHGAFWRFLKVHSCPQIRVQVLSMAHKASISKLQFHLPPSFRVLLLSPSLSSLVTRNVLLLEKSWWSFKASTRISRGQERFLLILQGSISLPCNAPMVICSSLIVIIIVLSCGWNPLELDC